MSARYKFGNHFETNAFSVVKNWMKSNATTVCFRFNQVFEKYKQSGLQLKLWFVCVIVIPLLMFKVVYISKYYQATLNI